MPQDSPLDSHEEPHPEPEGLAAFGPRPSALGGGLTDGRGRLRVDFRWPVAGLCLGLAAGFVELGAVLAQSWLTQAGLLRRNSHLFWMIPATDAALLTGVGVGLMLALVGRGPHGRRRRSWAVLGAWFVLLLVALVMPMLAVPGLKGLPSLVLAAGLTCWLAPPLAGQPGEWLSGRLRRAAPWLLAGFLALAGGRLAAAPVRGWIYGPRTAPPASAPNLILVVLDTVRADALSLAGPSSTGRTTSPHLARLAARGRRFDQAIAPSPWTLPTHASLFTGRWSHELSLGLDRPLGGHDPTLAEVLGQRGYDTAGIVGNLVFCTSEYGLGRGFATYEDYPVTVGETLRASALGWTLSGYVSRALDRLAMACGREPRHELELPFRRKTGREVTDRALEWIAQRRDPERPYFLFLNYYDAHDPYLVPAGADRPFGRAPVALDDFRYARRNIFAPEDAPAAVHHAAMRDAYDDCIVELDRQMGRLVAGLERLGQLDEQTILVVTSDHGEHFGEHLDAKGQPIVNHRKSVYQPEIHVPLLIVAPGRLPGRGVVGDRAVSLRDLPASLLALAGLDGDQQEEQEGAAEDSSPHHRPARLPGTPFLTAAPAPDPVLAELFPYRALPASLHGDDPDQQTVRAVVTRDRSYHQYGDGRELLFDLETDPDEQHDLAGDAQAQAWLEDARRHLEALGD